ncbi:hypothetical protein ACTA71_009012 [Dictyostelium dimigraforme]
MILDAGKKLRVERILSNLGVCERSRVPQFLKERRVTVLGKKATPSTRANVKDIKIEGKPIENGGPLHIAVHKPSGYICSTVNDGDHKIIYDILPKEFFKRKPTLSIAGRLDKWVTGLVVMSQDGKLVDRIITPKDDGCGKDYEVVLKDKIVGDEAEAFESGKMMLRGETEPCKPAKLEILDVEKNKVKVTLFEGRYHQIRRMFASTENKAVEIHRTRIGPVELGELGLGKWRYLTETEIKDLYAIKVDENTNKRDKKKAKLKAFLEKKKRIRQEKNKNEFGEVDDEEEYDEEDEEDYDEEYNEEYDEEYDEEEIRDMNKIYNEKGEIILGTTTTTMEAGEAATQSNKINNIKYEDKLKSLVESEEIESNKSNLFNTKDIIGNEDIDNIKDIDEENDEENEEEEEDDEEDEQEQLRRKRRENDPYADIRKQFHDKFRSMIRVNDKGAEFDEETGHYIPKSIRSSKYYNISDEELDRLSSLDSDIKIIEQEREQEELEEEQKQQELLEQQKKPRKRQNKVKEEKEEKEIFSSEDFDENIVRIDSTPEKVRKYKNLDKFKKSNQLKNNRKNKK